MAAKHGMTLVLVALLGGAALALPVVSEAQLSVSITLAPPPLPVYEQPEIPGAGLPVDAGLLGLRARGLLLGARDLGAAPAGRTAVDARLLGMVRGRVRLERGLLGSAGRLLWRSELWLRLRWPWLRGWLLAQQPVLLQPQRHAHQRRSHHQRVQQDGREQRDGAARELCRRPGRGRSAAHRTGTAGGATAACAADTGADSASRERSHAPRAAGERQPGQAADRSDRQAG